MMAGGGEYSWIMTDTGWRYTGLGPAPGCGPGCCGGCRVAGSIVSFSEKIGKTPDFMSNYVTKQELRDALSEFRGVCGMSIDKENSARCNRIKGHLGFCDRITAGSLGAI